MTFTEKMRPIGEEISHIRSYADSLLNGFQKSSICMKLNKQVKHISINGIRLKELLFKKKKITLPKN